MVENLQIKKIEERNARNIQNIDVNVVHAIHEKVTCHENCSCITVYYKFSHVPALYTYMYLDKLCQLF